MGIELARSLPRIGMGGECNDIPDQPAPVVLRNSGETSGDHLVVCCDLGEPGSDSLTEQALEQCVVAPMRRYGATRLRDVGHALFFEFAGADSQVFSSARAALEVMARLRNLSAVTRNDSHVRLGIACRREVAPQESASRSSLVNRARAASRLARNLEIIAERSLASVLDTAASWSELAPSAAGAQFVMLHAMCDGHSRMLQARRQQRVVIGRDAELKRVQESADAVFAGQGQVVGMSGRAGAGKTFLLSEIADNWIRAGGTGFIIRCKPSTQRQPLYPVFSCLLRLAGLHGNEDTTTRSERIMAALQKLGGTSSQLAVLEEVMLGGHGDHAPYHLITEWLANVFEEQTRHSPMLQIFEDVHFADPATLRLISALSQVAQHGRVLVITSYRPSRALGNLRRSLQSEILLAPLRVADIDRLACLHAPVQSLDPKLIEFLRMSGGHTPGRLLDLVEHLLLRGLVIAQDERLFLAPGSQDRAAQLATELAAQNLAMGTGALPRAGRGQIPSLREPPENSGEDNSPEDTSPEPFARRPTPRTR